MSDSLGAASIGKQMLADRYELRGLIGQGGMAEVHRAHDRLLDRTVAVKIFRLRDNPAARRRFDDEAHALARLAHPELVAIFDVGTVDDRPFLVMEFVGGTSLQARLLAGPLPLDQVLRIGGALADALAHAHHRGVVHRDVKPSNIVLDQENVPHLTDFGIALLAGTPRLTSANEILGTPAYLAPEQLSDTEVGPPADVYALGLVLLECLSGELEYASGTILEVALTRLNRPPRIPTGLPPELTGLLAAMTATEALDRPTAETCALRLLAAVDDTRPEVAPRKTVTMSPVADEPVARWADEDRTAHMAVGQATSAHSGPRRRLLAASVAGIAAGGRRADVPAEHAAAADRSAAGRHPRTQRVQHSHQHQWGESGSRHRTTWGPNTRRRDTRRRTHRGNARRTRTSGGGHHCTCPGLVHPEHAQDVALDADHDLAGDNAPANHGLDATTDDGVVRAAGDHVGLDGTAEHDQCSRQRDRWRFQPLNAVAPGGGLRVPDVGVRTPRMPAPPMAKSPARIEVDHSAVQFRVLGVSTLCNGVATLAYAGGTRPVERGDGRVPGCRERVFDRGQQYAAPHRPA